MKLVLALCLVLALLFWSGNSVAGPLTDRLANFPHWETKPPVQAAAAGDLIYPSWMAGTWRVTSTLIEQVVPLAPNIVTPGFESNRRYLNQPVSFTVRFVPLPSVPFFKLLPKVKVQTAIVADRGFNGLNLARAYLGDPALQAALRYRAVLSVKVDPDSPNRQVTSLRGARQLVSVVTGRTTEMSNGEFITTEVFQQLFRGTPRPYFNEVESTTEYRQLGSANPDVEADQVTAVYLSPQDPDYFIAGSQPVALYRYRLEFYSDS